MAKSALESINGCNLFGDKGASWSVIYVDIDAHNRNRSIFETLLPRESSSKVRTLWRPLEFGSALEIKIFLIVFKSSSRTQNTSECDVTKNDKDAPTLFAE